MQRRTGRHYRVRESKLKVSIGFLTFKIRTPWKRERNYRSQRGWRTSREYSPLNQLIRAHGDWSSKQGCYRGAKKVFCIYLSLIFCRTPNNGRRWISDSFAWSWVSFSPTVLPCPTLIRALLPCLIVSCFLLFACYVLEAYVFLKRKWRGIGYGEMEMAGRCGRVTMHNWRRGNCDLDILYERRIYLNKNKNKWLGKFIPFVTKIKIFNLCIIFKIV